MCKNRRSEKFDLRLSPADLEKLDILTVCIGIKSRSEVIRRLIDAEYEAYSYNPEAEESTTPDDAS